MKQFLVLILLLISSTTFAQLEISTADISEGIWNEKDSTWEIYSKEIKTTFFKFNKELSAFDQISLESSAGYLITRWDFDEKISKYTMDLQTKDGKKQEMVIDGMNQFIAFFYWKNETYCMTRFSVKESAFQK